MDEQDRGQKESSERINNALGRWFEFPACSWDEVVTLFLAGG